MLAAASRHEARIRCIVCFGVGHFADGGAPTTQFAAVCALRDALRDAEPVRCVLYDPVLSATEVSAAEVLGWSVPGDNPRGAWRVDCLTLFFMPHCGLPLYARVIAANSDTLDRVVVVGNSFSEYDLCAVAADGHNRQALRVLRRVLPIVCEAPLPVGEWISAFNNTAYHTFTAAVAPLPAEDFAELVACGDGEVV